MWNLEMSNSVHWKYRTDIHIRDLLVLADLLAYKIEHFVFILQSERLIFFRVHSIVDVDPAPNSSDEI